MRLIKSYVFANGARFCVYDFGGEAGAGDPVLLLHPSGVNSFIWHKVAPLLASRHRVLAVDLRGFGESDLPPDGYSMENQARDIAGVLDGLGIGRAHLVGNSLGTDAAVYCAAMFPEKVSSLVNIDAGMINFIGPGGEREGAKEEVVSGFIGRPYNAFGSLSEAEQFVRAGWWSTFGQEYVEYAASFAKLYLLPSGGGFTFDMPKAVYRHLLEAWCDMRFDLMYPLVSCPVLFLPAEKEANLDRKLAAIESFKALGNLPLVETIVIEGMTHIPLVSHAHELADTILSFIERLD